MSCRRHGFYTLSAFSNNTLGKRPNMTGESVDWDANQQLAQTSTNYVQERERERERMKNIPVDIHSPMMVKQVHLKVVLHGIIYRSML